MEATQTPNPLSFETVWAALMEDRERIKELRQVMNESFDRSERERKETERYLKEIFDRSEREREKNSAEFNKRLGEYINLFGEVTEYEMSPKMREKFAGFGLDFPKTTRNVSIRDNINGIFFEIDAMLENGNTAMLVEIKTELTVERIKKHIIRLEKMRKYADLHGDKRAFLGAVAGVVVTDNEREYALDQGFYLIEPAGQDLNITPPNNKPKEW